jgi:hypothetical protein|tara:strand:- start:9465 stop:9647 length:183 start_codon:yes stop_codon:yes gene_type:complete
MARRTANANAQAMNAVLDEFRAIKKRGKKTKKPLFMGPRNANPIVKWYADHNLNPDLFRE